jgi:hypothetical protein
MKNEKHQQAQNLYFQTNLSKTEIANQLGVNRRTIMLWCQQGNWDRLKLSAQHLPAIVAEKCYFLLDHYTSHLLSSNAVISTFGPREAGTINQMAASIKKLKNRSAVNEAMEMFNFFIEYVKKQDPEMVDLVAPLVEGYIATRKDINIDSFVPATFNNRGFMDESKREQEIIEQWQDEKDQPLMEQEYFEFLQYKQQKEEGEKERDNTAEQRTADETMVCHPEPRRRVTADESPAEQKTLGEPSRTMTADDSTQVEEPTDQPIMPLLEPRRRVTGEESAAAGQIPLGKPPLGDSDESDAHAA